MWHTATIWRMAENERRGEQYFDKNIFRAEAPTNCRASVRKMCGYQAVNEVHSNPPCQLAGEADARGVDIVVTAEHSDPRAGQPAPARTVPGAFSLENAPGRLLPPKRQMAATFAPVVHTRGELPGGLWGPCLK
jgi:hypothetical protein